MVNGLRRSSEDADRLGIGPAVLLACLLVLAVVAVALMRPTWRAAAVLRDTVDAPADIAQRVSEDTVAITSDLSARLFRPVDAQGPLPTFVIIHGAIGQGPDDPRLVDLSRALAARGAVVVAPVLEALARFRLDVEDVDRVAATIEWVVDEPDVAVGPVGVLGISIGGSYGLLAAMDERVADDVSTIMVFGGYHDLGPLLSRWLTDPADTDTVLDPFREGRWLVLLGNVDRTVEDEDVGAVSACLRALLDGAPCQTDDDLGPRARLMVDAALSEAALSPAAAAMLLDPLAPDIETLSPSNLTAAPTVPIYLLHAVGDPVVPITDLPLIEATLTDLGADVRVHTTDVFEHVDTDSLPSLLDIWPLVRFVAGFLDDAGM